MVDDLARRQIAAIADHMGTMHGLSQRVLHDRLCEISFAHLLPFLLAPFPMNGAEPCCHKASSSGHAAWHLLASSLLDYDSLETV